MKKLLAIVITLITIVSMGTAVIAYPMPQDIGTYTNYAINIFSTVVFQKQRYMLFPATYGIHNNSYIATSYFTTRICDSNATAATGSKIIRSGNRVTLSYYSNYSNRTEYTYRLSITNQSQYGNSGSGSWAPNDNVQ